MTREELKKHCEKQIEMCELWAANKGEKPSGKIYEEHKLILELLEQDPILDKVRIKVEELKPNNPSFKGYFEQNVALNKVLEVIDQIRAEINSPNRGTCDYFIVDRIEEIIDKYKAEGEIKNE